MSPEKFAIHWKRWSAESLEKGLVVPPDETREAERACVNTTSDQNYWT